MLRAVVVEGERREAWDALAIQEPFFALMQSWEWGEYKARLGWKVYRVGVEADGDLVAGAQVLIRADPLGLASVAYIPRGPIGCWMEEGAFTALFDQAQAIARDWNAVFLKVEPAAAVCSEVEGLFARHQFNRAHHTSQPLATIVMDIAQPDEAILQNMRKSTRRKIFTADRKGVRVCAGGLEQLGAFYRLMKVTARRAGFAPKSFETYKCEWKSFADCCRAGFFLAYYEDTLLAAHIAYTFGPHAAFFHQVSSGEYSNFNANCRLVWEDIQWAKSRGCRTYDLWGIPDEVDETKCEDEEADEADRTDGLWGVYKFKRGFSKDIVHFCGSFDRVYQPLLYRSMMNDRIYGGLERAQTWLARNLAAHT